MEYTYRPRVSRETRRLLATAAVALAILWLLARARFPEQPVAPNPVQPLLTQLAPPLAFEDLAASIAKVRERVEPAIETVRVESSVAAPVSSDQQSIVALRIGNAHAIAWLPSAVDVERGPLIAVDTTSRVAVLQSRETGAAPPAWMPSAASRPRYMIAAEPSRQGASFRPVFVAGLDEVTTPLTGAPVWALPVGTDVLPGAFMFTLEGDVAGMVLREGSDLLLIPADHLTTLAETVIRDAAIEAGDLGLEVQPLSGAVAALLGVGSGVIVTAIADDVARSGLEAGDVIEALNSEPVPDVRHWRVRSRRIPAGSNATLTVRRAGVVQDVTIVARAPAASSDRGDLGLRMRYRRGEGSEITRVESGSVADRAGLRDGDIVTKVGNALRPIPSEVRRALLAAQEGPPVLVVVTRGNQHLVAAVDW